MTTPLVDYQCELGGVLIGKDTPVLIAAIEGLGQAPLRVTDVDPPTEDGTWLGIDRYSGRTIRIDAGIRDTGNAAGVLDKLGELQTAAGDAAVRGVGGATMDLRIKFPGREVRVVRGRLRKLDVDLSKVIHGWAPVDVEFTAADHLYYADEAESVSIPLGVISGGGFAAPVTAPIHVTTGVPAQRPGKIFVDGNAPTWPVLRVIGPCTNPRITHLETGRTLNLNLTLADGEWVEIDTRPTWRSVLRNNGGAVPLNAGSRIDQFQLPPGQSEVRWSALNNTSNSALTVTWWPAWATL